MAFRAVPGMNKVVGEHQGPCDDYHCVVAARWHVVVGHHAKHFPTLFPSLLTICGPNVFSSPFDTGGALDLPLARARPLTHVG